MFGKKFREAVVTCSDMSIIFGARCYARVLFTDFNNTVGAKRGKIDRTNTIAVPSFIVREVWNEDISKIPAQI